VEPSRRPKPKGSTNDNETKEDSYEATSAASNTLVATAVTASLFTGDYVSLWRLINTLQLLSLFNFSSVDVPPQLAGFLEGLLKESRIPNLYKILWGDNHDETDMPNRFKTLKYDHPAFFDITGHVLTIWLAMSILVGFALVLRGCGLAKVRQIAKKVSEAMFYNGCIRMALESCVYFFLAICLNLHYGVSNSQIAFTNLAFSIIAAILLLAYHIAI
jgi:hypothetical protein